jgi:very-short-patch-repair endonuclease
LIPVDRHRGLPVTPRPDSVLDVLGEMPLTAGGSLLDRALQQQWLSPIQITQRLAEPARGNPRLRTLARVLGDGAEAESERQLHRLLRQAGIRNWRPNHTVTARGRRYRLDVALPEAMIAIEVDGMAWHLQSDRKQQDLDRQNDLVESGWTVLRFTWNDIMYRPDYVIGRIRRAIATAAGARWGGSASA